MLVMSSKHEIEIANQSVVLHIGTLVLQVHVYGVQAGCVLMWRICEVSSVTVKKRYCRLLAVEGQHDRDCRTDGCGRSL